MLTFKRPAILVPAPSNPEATAHVASILEGYGTVIREEDSGEVQFIFKDDDGNLIHLVVRADFY